MAVGEMSPEEYSMNFGSKLSQNPSPRIKKQDSYLQAIGNTEDELTPLPKRASVRKQESYQRAVLAGGVGSFTTGNFNQEYFFTKSAEKKIVT